MMSLTLKSHFDLMYDKVAVDLQTVVFTELFIQKKKKKK